MKFVSHKSQPKQTLPQSPPKPGYHAPPKPIVVSGGHLAGNQSAALHPSLKKPSSSNPKLMRGR